MRTFRIKPIDRYLRQCSQSWPKWPESDSPPHDVTQIWLFNDKCTNHMESDLFKSDLGHFHMWFLNQTQIRFFSNVTSVWTAMWPEFNATFTSLYINIPHNLAQAKGPAGVAQWKQTWKTTATEVVSPVLDFTWGEMSVQAKHEWSYHNGCLYASKRKC